MLLGGSTSAERAFELGCITRRLMCSKTHIVWSSGFN